MNVAIVGAGINGLYLAWKLSQKGINIDVFEKRKEIGKVACSGLFSERILGFIPKSRTLIQNEINSALIHFPGRTIRLNFSKKFYVMSHFDLDNLVAGEARSSGTNIYMETTVESVDDLKRKYDRVIGSDGPLSAVRKNLNLPDLKFRLGILGFVSKEDKSSFVETWPVKNGFIWRIPRGKNIEYGIISDTKNAKSYFDTFLKKNCISLESMHSALIPQGLGTSFDDQITLCGDAAGLTKPWSGGGVIWGLIAADLLIAEFPDFKRYNYRVNNFFSKKIMMSKIGTQLAYFVGHNTPWILPKNINIESDFLF